MGRRIRTSDMQGDLEQLLGHCLELADEAGMQMTAIRIAGALDQYRLEGTRGTVATSNLVAPRNRPDTPAH